MNLFKNKLHYFRPSVDFKYKRVLTVAGISILAVLILVFMVRPGITGYSVYKKIKNSNLTVESYESQVDRLKTEALVTNANLTSCQSFNGELFSQLDGYLERVSSCEQEVSTLKVSLEAKTSLLAREKDDREERLEELEAEINETQDDYDQLVENSANIICCIEKITNSKIDSYTVDNNKIDCVEGGDETISCF